jgi:Ca-activated chloride channel family protein
MLRHAFAHPWMLWFLTALPVLVALGVWSERRRRQALARLGDPPAVEMQMASRRGRRWLLGLCFLLGLTSLGVGMAGPQWGRDWNQSAAPGRDVVVVLDCSRSMLAESPSRLERAREALLDLADAVERRGGHRLALVLFAGKARLACPLTHDYDHFRSQLNNVQAVAQERDLEPGAGTNSGTRLGQALALAATGDDSRFADTRDLLLLSDGDDPGHDAEWRNGARLALALGIRIYAIGIGDPNTANIIPLDTGPLLYEGQPVRTRLEEAPLREIAESTGGTYISARTRTLPLGELYLDLIESQPRREDSDDALPVYQQRYAWFLAPAFGLLALFTLLGDGSVRKTAVVDAASQETSQGPARLAGPTNLVVLFLGLLVTKEPGPETLLQEGRRAMARGDYERAAMLYERAEIHSTDPATTAFYLAGAKYHLAAKTEGVTAELLEAEQLYRCCLNSSDPHRPRALCGLGNCLLRKSGGSDEGNLRAALTCFDLCLQAAGDDAVLLDNARYNREKTRLSLLQFQPPVHDPNGDRPPDDDFNPHPPRFDPRQAMPTMAGEPGDDGNAEPQTSSGDANSDPGKNAPKNNDPPQPGKGNLPPIPDEVETPPLPPQLAADHLQAATKKVLQERQMHHRRSEESSAKGVKDW